VDLLVAVSEDVGLTAEHIAHQWNSSDRCTAIAVARTVPNQADNYSFVELLDAVLVVLGSIATGVAGNAAYELLKEVLSPSAHGRHVDYKEVRKSDGTTIVEFHISEDQ
jgi:hypothetical protein